MSRDFEEFFASLNARRVEFLIIGGTAYNFHAPPRATKDIDIWVRPERANLERLLLAIGEFGFPVAGLDIDELERLPRVLMLGAVPNRIDVLMRPAGVEWERAWPAKVPGTYGAARVFYLSRADLIAAKRAAGRPRDLADAAILEDMARFEPRRDEDGELPTPGYQLAWGG